MKKLVLIAFFTCIAAFTKSYAQFSRYVIQLKDKTGSTFSIDNPQQFLSQRSIERRIKYNISIDESDLPIPQTYLDSIRLSGDVTILNVSKWLNQVCIQTTDAVALNKINLFSFVKAALPIAARMSNEINPQNKEYDDFEEAAPLKPSQRPQGTTDYYDYGTSYAQVHLQNTDFLHNHGFRGEGMQLAIMDAGFYHYQSLPTFDSVRNNSQILGTWDFVANEASVDEDFVHGMNCFSTIAANMPGVFVGTAPKTSFFLFRTEDTESEYPVEEQNFAAAAEQADSVGVDVFSVSLGYATFDNSRFNYTYANMDGNTTISARAADFAAKKGIMVVVAAGNEGNKTWHYILTPADADSVLTIGAVDVNRQVADFSSYGPTSDGQIKPGVATVGVRAVVANSNTGNPSLGNGTSFACPIMAGSATCLWQAFPEMNNMQIIDALLKSSDRYSAPDNRTGYGIPDLKKAFVSLIKKLYTQSIAINNNCKTSINCTVKTAADMSIAIERKLPADTNYKTISTQIHNGSFAMANFSYTDDLSILNIGTVIKYRIKMVIASDTSFYLDSAIVNYTQSCNDGIVISPNPVADNIFIQITSNKTVNTAIEMYNLNGQKIYSLKDLPVNGTQTFTIPVKQFSPGIYFVAVFSDNKKAITKKILVR
jgi:subtilisin family serine protease